MCTVLSGWPASPGISLWQCNSHLNFKTCTDSLLFSKPFPKLAQPVAHISVFYADDQFCPCAIPSGGWLSHRWTYSGLLWSPPLSGHDSQIPDPSIIPVAPLCTSRRVDHCRPNVPSTTQSYQALSSWNIFSCGHFASPQWKIKLCLCCWPRLLLPALPFFYFHTSALGYL